MEEEEVVIGKVDQVGTAEDTKTKISLMMVGKLLNERPFNFEAMERTFRAIWRLRNDMAVRMVESKLFIFQFSSVLDKEKVVNGCLWFFDNQLLMLKEINGEEQLSNINVFTTPYWIRVYDVPLLGEMLQL
ncbi:Nuclease SbcCD subunit D [Bienertia sinuspersici]